MKNRLPVLFVAFCTVLFLGKLSTYSNGAEEHHGGHEAHHGGVLNVIGEEVGHVEVRIEGDTLVAWFVGGGHDTNRAVPIKDKEIALKVSVPGKGEMTLILNASPMKLAGEKVGHCSRFVAKADWLREVKEFQARGEVVFKGILHELLIKYPKGHDPMHGQGSH